MRRPAETGTLLSARRHVLVTAGAGADPGVSLAHTLAARGADWRVVHDGAARLASLDPARLRQVPSGGAGLSQVVTALEACDPGTVVWCFGPAPLLEAVSEAHAFLPFLGPLQVEHHDADQGAVLAGV